MKKAYIGVLLMLCISLAGAADEFELKNIQLSILGQSPDPAVAGGIVEVRLQLENTGHSEVNGVTIGLGYAYPFVPIPGEPQNQTILSLLPDSEDYGITNLNFRVGIDPTAGEGEYKLKINRKAVGANWMDSVDTVTIRVTGEEFAEIKLDKTELDPGEETEVIFTITNTGDAPLNNLAFSWEEEEDIVLPVGSDNTRYIKQLQIGDSEELTYTIVTSMNTDPGVYKLDLKLEYEVLDSNGNYVKTTLNRDIGLIVGGETSFDVTFSESSEGQTSLSVANVGNNPALAVTVRIPNQESYSVSGSTASIIGNLDSGDYTIVSFQIAQKAMFNASQMQFPRTGLEGFSGERPTNNNLKVQIEYTDTIGKRQTVEKLVPIQFRDLDTESVSTFQSMRNRSAGFSLFGLRIGWEVILIALVALALIAFFLYKKIRKKPKTV